MENTENVHLKHDQGNVLFHYQSTCNFYRDLIMSEWLF